VADSSTNSPVRKGATHCPAKSLTELLSDCVYVGPADSKAKPLIARMKAARRDERYRIFVRVRNRASTCFINSAHYQAHPETRFLLRAPPPIAEPAMPGLMVALKNLSELSCIP
jgi:hypothetical protein